MTDLTRSPLGHAATYADAYDPRLLFPVERAPLRVHSGFIPESGGTVKGRPGCKSFINP